MKNKDRPASATHRNLCRLLSARQKVLGVTKADLARLSGMSKSSVARLLTGEVDNPTFSSLYRLAQALGLDITLSPAAGAAQAA